MKTSITYQGGGAGLSDEEITQTYLGMAPSIDPEEMLLSIIEKDNTVFLPDIPLSMVKRVVFEP